jgi:hypothetical protein
MKPSRARILSYERHQKSGDRPVPTSARNQIGAAIDSLWVIVKRVAQWLYELSLWLG